MGLHMDLHLLLLFLLIHISHFGANTTFVDNKLEGGVGVGVGVGVVVLGVGGWVGRRCTTVL